MISEISTDYVASTFEWTMSRTISLDVKETCVLRGILQNSGDGFRPFHPLEGTINGNALALPMDLVPGTYVVQLTAERFEGTGLMLLGYDLQNVTRVSLNEASSAATPPVSHTEYISYGPPSNLVGANGATHFDQAPATSGGQIGYMKMGGTWRQLGS
jgi:hypothetical protein